MSNSRYVVGLLGLLLLTSISSAYTVLGGAFYCGNSSMTGDQICADCTNALNNNTYNFTFLNESVSGATANCINDPNLINFKTFDCNGHTISGTHAGSTYGIDIEGEFDVRIIGCEVSGFTHGYYIADSSDNITVFNATSYNNTNHGFYVLSSTNITVLNATSYNNTNTGYRLRFSDECELDSTIAYENVYGYYLDNSDYTDILDSNATNNSFRGYYIYQSIFADVTDSIADSNGVGCNIQDDLSDYNSIDNLTVYESTSQGIYVNGGDNNTISSSNVSNNLGVGIEFYQNADDNVIQGTLVDSNGRSPGNPYSGIYIHETCLRNNITITNVSNSGWDGIKIFQSCDYTYLYNVRSFYNNRSGINISQESDLTDIVNSPVYGNGQHGIYIYNSDSTEIYSVNLLPSPYTNVYDNNESGIYLEQAGYTNIAGLLRNLSIYSNEIHGIVFDQTSNGNLSGLNVHDNGNSGGHGVAVDSTSTLNTIRSSFVHENGWSGFGIDGTNNVFDDNLVFGNTFHGFHINTNGNNNLSENEIYNNTQHGLFIQVDNNNFWNNTLYGNGQTAGTHNIYMPNTADNNMFYNTLILTNKTGFGTLRHIQQDATATTPNNFTNLTVCYNESIGCAAWNLLNLSSATLDASNFVAHPQFISLDDSIGGGANEFNKSANLTIAVDSCSPTPRVIRATGFPTTLAAILASGNTYPTTRTCSNNVFSFNVSSFSGYAANTTINACFYANNPDTVYNIAANLVGNKSDGICITLNASNILINCSGMSVTGNDSVGNTYGIAQAMGGPYLENISIQGCFVNNYTEEGISFRSNSANVSLLDNVAFNNSIGIFLTATNYSVMHNNTAYRNSVRGIEMRGVTMNITSNIAYNNTGYGISTDVGGGIRNDLMFMDNIAYNNTHGIGLLLLVNSTAFNNTVYDNTNYGFAVTGANSTIYDNTAYNNLLDGFVLVQTINMNLTNNTAYNNSQYGCHLWAANDTDLNYMSYYNNGYDLFVNNSGATALALDVVNNTFLNPLGTLANYTVLSVADSIGSGEAFSINWTVNSTALPTNYISFQSKFVNISTQNGTVSIDAITWQWTPAELGGYNETRFVLSKYNASGWTHLNNTPDTVEHTLSLTNMNPASDYGILQNESPYCMLITSPGTYQLGGNAVGAPYNSSEVWPVGFEGWSCVKIASDDVEFSCNGYNITNNGTSSAYGILVNGSAGVDYTNITIRDCPMVNGYQQGVYVHYSDQDEVRNVTVSSSSGQGIFVFNSQNINVTDNLISNISNGGIMAWAGNNNLIRGNTVNGSLHGIRLYGGEEHSTVDSNMAYNNTYGLSVDNVNPNNNTLENNRAYENQYGIYLSAANENNITNNTAYNNSQAGFYLTGNADGNNLVNNTAYISNMGFYMLSSSLNFLFNNTAWGSTLYGFYFTSTDGDTLLNNTAYNNTQHGFYFTSTTNGNLVNANSFDNNYGIYLSRSDVDIFGGKSNSNNRGLYIAAFVVDAAAVVQNLHLYNNTQYDFITSSDGSATYTINATNMTIDNPAGNFQNYTSLSINDSSSANEAYQITWNPEPAVPIAGYFSFEQKYINITNTVGTHSIGQIRFNWDTAELPGYNENRFELWKHNGTWSYVTGQTLSTANNYLEILNLNPASTFGILQNNLSQCFIINSSGNYQLANAVQGAPFSIAGVTDISQACIIIAADDVDFSCSGNSITNNGTADAAAVVINGSAGVDYANVTVRDCPSISQYEFGVYVHSSSLDRVNNVTSFNNSGEGIRVRGSTYTNITGNIVFNNTNTGILTRANGILNDHLLVKDNTAYNNTNGIAITLTGNSTVADNEAYNNTNGFIVFSTSYTSFENNTAYENANTGFNALLAWELNFTNNTAYGNAWNGFYFGTNDSRYVNNTAYENGQSGFYIQLAYTNTLIDNEAYNNAWHGFQIDNGIFNTFTYDVSYNNTISGFYIIGNYTNLTNVTAYNNSGGIGFNSASFNIVESPNLFLNDRAGRYEIYLDAGSDRNTVSNAYLWQTTNYLQQTATAAYPNNLTNFSIAHNTTVGIINWPLLSVTDIQLDSTTTLPEPTFVSINSASEPEANAPANVTIYTPLCPNPTIYSRAGFPQTRGDILANGSIYATTIHSCAANLVKFDVAGFSGYSTGNYSNLTIWDSNDTGSVIYSGSPAKFFANYSNSTNGAPIDNTIGSCFVRYNDSAAVYAMTYNTTSLLWEHNKAFSDPGNYTWNVTCNSTAGYDTLFAEDEIPILLGCFYADSAGLYNVPNNLTGNKTDGACITVNASNVIIDCGGNGISGIMAPGSGTYGIFVDNVDSVELRNCYATAYDIGYYLDGATNSEVHNNTAEGNFQDGFNATQSTNVNLYRNNVTDNGNTGFAILGDSINVTNNTIDEGTLATFGIFSISDATYGDNNIFSYNNILQVNLGSAGIFAAGTGNTISYNDVTGVSSTGIVCGDSPTVPIFTGTVLPCDSASITDNRVYGNFFGIMALNGDNVDIVDSDIFGNPQMNVLLLNSSGVLITTDEINTSAMGVGMVNSTDVLVHTNAIHTNPFGQVVLLGILDNITVEENVDALQSYVTVNSPLFPGAVTNITDLYLTYNYSDVNGMVHWDDVDFNTQANLNNLNFLLEQDFVSLNDTNATEFNTTADATLYTAACPVEVFRLEGFPQTRADIVENGTVYTSTFLTCAVGSAQFGVNGFSGYALNESVLPPPPTGGRGGGGPECTDAFIELEAIQCPDNKLLFIVKDADDIPVEGARVALVRETGSYWSDVRNTGSDGTVEFTLSSNAEYSVTVDGGAVEDYCSDSLTIDYVLCPEEGCYEDDDCLDTEYCDFDMPYSIDMPPELLDFVILPGVCTPVDCDCGEVYDHRCHEYDCCSNDDCEEGYVCENHECVPRECSSDSDCGESEQCVDGECIPIEIGDCGYIANHSWFEYECCNDSDCPEGYLCYEHECVLYWIETNETGFVGDMHKLIVHPEGQYTLDITDPDGRMLEITTDAEGRSQFQLETEGKYGIELIEEEVPVIMVDVDALKRPLPPPDEKPITIIDEFLKYFWWLLILLLLIIGYILFRRRKKKKYKIKE